MKRYSQSTQIASFSTNHGQNMSAPSGFMQPYKIQIQAEFICQTVRATDADVVRKNIKWTTTTTTTTTKPLSPKQVGVG